MDRSLSRIEFSSLATAIETQKGQLRHTANRHSLLCRYHFADRALRLVQWAQLNPLKGYVVASGWQVQ